VPDPKSAKPDTTKIKARLRALNAGLKAKKDVAKNSNEWMDNNRDLKKARESK
jgi:hypothetical protein